MRKQFQIAYGFSNCSDKLYRKLIQQKKKYVMVTDQKYHALLYRGFSKNNALINCFSGLPINNEVTKRIYIHEKNDEENGIRFHYYKTINIPFIRQIMIFIEAFFAILFSQIKYDFIFCDYMSSMNTYGLGLAGKIRNIPVIELVLDLPGLMNTTGDTVKGIYRKIAKLADGFVFLTEQMNDAVNIQNKPYIVVEGQVDTNLQDVPIEEKWEYKDGKKVIIYAGGIHKVFGIDILVQGFIKASIEDSELRIFGDGDYRDDLEKICQTHKNIKYMGVRDNTEIVKQEQRASLLVNPRPSTPVYTKYSFPSKNMEYMVSGTPVLTTNLPGMPKEYKNYVYIIDNETIDGIAKSLHDFFSKSIVERQHKSEMARKFVLEHKNNIIQTQRILYFFQNDILNTNCEEQK